LLQEYIDTEVPLLLENITDSCFVWNYLKTSPKPEVVLNLLRSATPETLRLSLTPPKCPKGNKSYLLMLNNPLDARCDIYGAWGCKNASSYAFDGLLHVYYSYHCRTSDFRRTIYSTSMNPSFVFVTYFGTAPSITTRPHGNVKKLYSPVYISTSSVKMVSISFANLEVSRNNALY
jgi:hypothetical protein